MEAERNGRGWSRRNERGEWKGRKLVKEQEEAKTRRRGICGGIFCY
jgi:hypothetical protein